jgi:acetyltransferase-like isoleucine patch superfamily enzyme
MVLTGKHIFRNEVVNTGRDVFIGKNVWIASGVIIIGRDGGIHIDDGCVIRAGSIITRDVKREVEVE